MRSSGLAVSLLLVPVALFAQHPSTAVVSHTTSSSPAASAHTPAGSSSTIHNGASSANRVGALHTTKAPNGANSNRRELSKSAGNSNPERRGLFWFLRKHRERNKCAHGRCSTNSLASANSKSAPIPAPALRGCTVVPIADPKLPCNPFAPCCP